MDVFLLLRCECLGGNMLRVRWRDLQHVVNFSVKAHGDLFDATSACHRSDPIVIGTEIIFAYAIEA